MASLSCTLRIYRGDMVTLTIIPLHFLFLLFPLRFSFLSRDFIYYFNPMNTTNSVVLSQEDPILMERLFSRMQGGEASLAPPSNPPSLPTSTHPSHPSQRYSLHLYYPPNYHSRCYSLRSRRLNLAVAHPSIPTDQQSCNLPSIFELASLICIL